MIIFILFISLFISHGYADDVCSLYTCDCYNEVHGHFNTCAPYVRKCTGFRVDASAPSFGTFRKIFNTWEHALEYSKDFIKTIDEWRKIHYTNYYDYNYRLTISPHCVLELPE